MGHLSKVAITGGAGFIGSHAADYFSRDDGQVVICDNFSRSRNLRTSGGGNPSYNWAYLQKRHPRMLLQEIDVRDFPLLESAVRGTDLIIHTAGQVAVTTSLKDPRNDFEVNVLGTLNVLEAARKNDAAVLFCSTNKVYGDNVNKIPLKTDRTRYSFDKSSTGQGVDELLSIDHTGHSPYGSSKLAADIYVQDYAHTYGLRTGVFRMSCIYGERQFGVEDQGWLAWFVIATVTGRPITIYGDGKQVRDVLYVRDLIEAFDLFLQSNLRHGVFNIGGGPENTLSLLELIELLQKTIGRRPQVSFGEWRASDQKVYISDIRKARQILGWKPTVDPQEGLKRVVNWVRENKALFA